MMGNWGDYNNWQMIGWERGSIFGVGFGLLFVWSIFWKGLALWKSARNDERYWFIALLLINTVGILELLYLFIFAKNKLVLVSEPRKSTQGRSASGGKTSKN